MVSPIVRQQNILQSSMTERIQQIQQQHPEMQQRYFEIQLREERKKMLQRVKNPEDTDQVVIHDEESRKHEQASGKDDGQNGQGEQPAGEGQIPNHVDVKV